MAGLAWLEARRGNEVAVPPARRPRGGARRAAPRDDRADLGRVRARRPRARSGAHGRGPRAVCLPRRALRRARIRDVDLSPAPELAEVLLRTGEVSRAAEVAAEHRGEAERKARPWSLARAWRITGLLSGDDDLDAAFGTALRLARGDPRPLRDRPDRTSRTGRGCGGPGGGSTRGAAAGRYEAFERLGARPWAAAAADELAATGVTVAPHGATGLDLLTPRAADRPAARRRRTTRETAGALFLSPKTVEYHLRHVYTKLGITNRRELAELVTSGG